MCPPSDWPTDRTLAFRLSLRRTRVWDVRPSLLAAINSDQSEFSAWSAADAWSVTDHWSNQVARFSDRIRTTRRSKNRNKIYTENTHTHTDGQTHRYTVSQMHRHMDRDKDWYREGEGKSAFLQSTADAIKDYPLAFMISLKDESN